MQHTITTRMYPQEWESYPRPPPQDYLTASLGPMQAPPYSLCQYATRSWGPKLDPPHFRIELQCKCYLTASLASFPGLGTWLLLALLPLRRRLEMWLILAILHSSTSRKTTDTTTDVWELVTEWLSSYDKHTISHMTFSWHNWQLTWFWSHNVQQASAACQTMALLLIES